MREVISDTVRRDDRERQSWVERGRESRRLTLRRNIRVSSMALGALVLLCLLMRAIQLHHPDRLFLRLDDFNHHVGNFQADTGLGDVLQYF